MSLYEITKDYLDFLQLIENEEIEADVVADTLEAIEGEIEAKADDIACILKNIDAEIVAIKNEETKLAERRKAKQRTYDRIKEYLSRTLIAADLTKIETARNKIGFRKSEVVEIFNESEFITYAQAHRDEFLRYVAPQINKDAVKQALKNGAEVNGAKIVTKQNIQLN